MDWTGGVRRRYAPKVGSNANASARIALQKQKAYFARARTATHLNAGDQTVREDTHAVLASESASASRQYQPSIFSPLRPKADMHRQVDHDLSRPHAKPAMSSPSRRNQCDGSQIRCHSGSSALQPEDERLPSRSSSAAFHKRVCPAVVTAADSNVLDEEERLLTANRERLLARRDWLGLSAARPVSYKFPSSKDKGRIGKRRKVDESNIFEQRPTLQRPMTPLFNEPFPRVDHAMSGALQDHSILIKVGTDALESQAQGTQPLRTPPVNTSMRQPSTDAGSLSEESMLLGVDGDGFEIGTLTSFANMKPTLETIDTAFNRPNLQDTDAMTLLTDSTKPNAPTFGADHRPDGAYRLLEGTTDMTENTAFRSSSFQYEAVQRAQSSRATSSARAWDEDDLEKFSTLGLPEPPGMEDEDERIWRRLSQVEYSIAIDSSAALPSLPYHDTQPESSARRPVHVLPSRSRIAGCHEAISVETNATHQQDPELGTVKLAVDDSDRDEELWREFVIGSQDSDSLFHYRHKPSIPPESDIIHVASAESFASTSSTALMEQLRSDRVTLGGSIFTKAASHEYTTSADRLPSVYDVNTSMAGNAATTHRNDDEIGETDRDGVSSRTNGNIHASSTVPISNSNRYRRPKRRDRRASGLLDVGEADRMGRRRDVYDFPG